VKPPARLSSRIDRYSAWEPSEGSDPLGNKLSASSGGHYDLWCLQRRRSAFRGRGQGASAAGKRDQKQRPSPATIDPEKATALDLLLTAWWMPVIVAPFVGSFLGVLILRLPRQESVVWDRSRCPHCRQRLKAIDLVPYVSWLAARGRCRYCSARLSVFYPGIEIAATGVALWSAAVVPGGGLLWATCVLGWTLLALAAIDWQHLILPDSLTLPLLALGLVIAGLHDGAALVDHGIGAAAGVSSFLGLAFLYRCIRGREGLGAGDAKLLGAAGAWVSWTGLPGVVLWAAAAALCAVLMKLASGRRVTASEQIPFGTYLCLGTWLVWLYGPVVLAWPE
jgi:leader peptidase (prepilin peptidase) / N-methyltransferase